MFILRVFSCMLIYSEHVHKWGKESHTIQQNEHKQYNHQLAKTLKPPTALRRILQFRLSLPAEQEITCQVVLMARLICVSPTLILSF